MPFAFAMVIGLTIALIIFFGAWAVAADNTGERSLTFALAGATAEPEPAEDPAPSSNPFQGGSLGASDEDADDTWWGQAFLKACPLH